MESERVNMQFKAIVDKQIAADRRRGFPVDFNSDVERQAQLAKDLIGLMGEIGEFANLVKKVGLRIAHTGYDGPSLEDASDKLREELADSIIYIIRLSAILGADLEQDVLAKMQRNDIRYRSFEPD
jgi:NTP pyrophosphatase (non-canonical NTP hydrolase)